MNNPIPACSPLVIFEYALFLIYRDPDTIVFQHEIEPFMGLVIRDDEVLNFDSMTDRVFGKVNKDILKEDQHKFRVFPSRT